MYVGSSSAADCMSMLNRRAQEKNPQNTDFTALLMENYHHTDRTSASNKGTIVEPEPVIGEPHIPTDLGLYTRPDNYDTFRQNILDWNLNGQAKLTEEMFSIGNIGQKYLNAAGCAALQEARIENALPILPVSIEDSQQRYAAAYSHLDVYAYEMFENRGLEVCQSLTAANFVGFNGYYQAGGAVRVRMDWENGKPRIDYEQLAQLNGREMTAVRQSDEYQEITILTEEAALYGAIAKLAETNEDFRRAYNENPQLAATNYSQELASTMESVKMPTVYNIRDEKRLGWTASTR